MKSKFTENFNAAMSNDVLTTLETNHLIAISNGTKIRAYARAGRVGRWWFALEGGGLSGTVYLGVTMRALLVRGYVHAVENGIVTLTKLGCKAIYKPALWTPRNVATDCWYDASRPIAEGQLIGATCPIEKK